MRKKERLTMDWMRKFIDTMFPIDTKNINIEEAFEEAFRLKYQHIPKSLFKYRAINKNSIKNFEENTIWLSNPSTFNDPYDCALTVDFERLSNELVKQDLNGFLSLLVKQQVSEDIIKSIRSSDSPLDVVTEHFLESEPERRKIELKKLIAEIGQERYRKLLEQFLALLKKSYKICSFSERNDSLLMWSHYADSHKGFCIEYDISVLPYGDHRSRFMFPVVYSPEIFDATSNLRYKESNNFNNLRYILSAMTKSTDWSYEKEWRLIFPHGIFEHDRPFPMPLPKALYLGCKIEDSNYNSLMRIASEKKIPVYEISLSNKEFRMSTKEIK
jgi:Protein of unknown function (DUF2971)